MVRKRLLCYPEDCTNENCEKIQRTSFHSESDQQFQDRNKTNVSARPVETNAHKSTQLRKSYLKQKTTTDKSISCPLLNSKQQLIKQQSESIQELSLYSSSSLISTDSKNDNIENTDIERKLNDNITVTDEFLNKCSESCEVNVKFEEIGKKYKDLQNFTKKLEQTSKALEYVYNDVSNLTDSSKYTEQSTRISPDILNEGFIENQSKKHEAMYEEYHSPFSNPKEQILHDSKKNKSFFGRIKLLKSSGRNPESNDHTCKSNYDRIHVGLTKEEKLKNAPIEKGSGKPCTSSCPNREKSEEDEMRRAKSISKYHSIFGKIDNHSSIDRRIAPAQTQSSRKSIASDHKTNRETQGSAYDTDQAGKSFLCSSDGRLVNESKGKKFVTEDKRIIPQSRVITSGKTCSSTACRSIITTSEKEEIISVVPLSSDDSQESPTNNDLSVETSSNENLILRIEIDLKIILDYLKTACFRVFFGPSLDESAIFSWELTNIIFGRHHSR